MISICDNTLATPYLLQPLRFDFDIVVSDGQSLSAGFNIPEFGRGSWKRENSYEKLKFLKNILGSHERCWGRLFKKYCRNI